MINCKLDELSLKQVIGTILARLQNCYTIESLVLWVSENRTDNIEMLERDELCIIINELHDYELCEYLRNEILTIADEIGLIDNINDSYQREIVYLIEKYKISEEHLFWDANSEELKALRKVIKQLRYKYRQSISQKATRAAKNLLKELNIKTETSTKK